MQFHHVRYLIYDWKSSHIYALVCILHLTLYLINICNSRETKIFPPNLKKMYSEIYFRRVISKWGMTPLPRKDACEAKFNLYPHEWTWSYSLKYLGEQ